MITPCGYNGILTKRNLMKILFLNTWHGKLRVPLTKFIQTQLHDTHLFCFQEVRDDMILICEELLTRYKSITATKHITQTDYFAQASYLHTDISIISSETLLHRFPACGLGIYSHIQYQNQDVHVINMHGISKPGDKQDTQGRLQQSSAIIDLLKNKEGVKIIGGDFNLLPETQSVSMFEENGYRNLIKDYVIDTTRNRLAWEQYPCKQLHADYVFVSQDIKVTGFSVPKNEISDHLPLLLDIEL